VPSGLVEGSKRATAPAWSNKIGATRTENIRDHQSRGTLSGTNMQPLPPPADRRYQTGPEWYGFPGGSTELSRNCRASRPARSSRKSRKAWQGSAGTAGKVFRVSPASPQARQGSVEAGRAPAGWWSIAWHVRVLAGDVGFLNRSNPGQKCQNRGQARSATTCVAWMALSKCASISALSAIRVLC
jgi:hypothetical protein